MRGMTKLHALDELGELRRALAQARADALEAERTARERAAAEARERDLFARTVGPVEPLRHAASPPPWTEPPAPVPRQRLRDEARVMHEAISDEFDVESLLETDDALSFRRRGIGAEVVRKLRRGAWAVQAQCDLHGLRRDEAREQLAAFLRQSARAGHRCVRVIHGKGLGSPGREPVLKGKVKSWLVQKSEVIAFTQARASDGGTGALMVLLAAPASRHPAPGAGAVPGRRDD